MAGCLNFVEGENVSPKNVRRWTEKLSNVLHNSIARQRFNDYLESRELEEGQTLLKFWEKCDKFLIKAEKVNQDTQDRRQKNLQRQTRNTEEDDYRNHSTELLLKDAQEIVQFAEEEINFDATMYTLNSAFQSGDTKKIITAVSEAKQIAAEKLEHEGYQEFCSYLLKKQGLLMDGD